jgi:hypothetical protein
MLHNCPNRRASIDQDAVQSGTYRFLGCFRRFADKLQGNAPKHTLSVPYACFLTNCLETSFGTGTIARKIGKAVRAPTTLAALGKEREPQQAKAGHARQFFESAIDGSR